MARSLRKAKGGIVYHVYNRGNGRMRLFNKPADYEAFLEVLAQATARVNVEILAYCVMPTHWHLVLRPKGDRDLSEFMRWVGVTHVRRHHQHHHNRAGGHLYQGRYKSFPVQEDAHLLNVLRFVEANALRAKLVERAEDWEYGSLWARAQRTKPVPLAKWPMTLPRKWVEKVNAVIETPMLKMLRQAIQRGRPYGETAWMLKTASALKLDSSIRPLGRPKNQERKSGNGK